MKEQAYDTLVVKISSWDPSHAWFTVLSAVRYSSLCFRKKVALLCRTRCTPIEGERLDAMVSGVISEHLMNLIDPIVTDRLLSSLLLCLVRMAPYTPTQVSHYLRESANKETRVLESSPRCSELNYAVFFGRYEEALHPSFDPNPQGAQEVHEAIDRWVKSLVCQRVFFPKVSRKSVSRTTYEDFVCVFPDQRWREPSDLSQEDLEVAYHESGEIISGVCEMRQKWYTSILSPRTYFAAGGHEYWLSKYFAKPFSKLCDMMLCTHRFDCTNPTRLFILEGHHALLYDLTCFTSNCHELRHFLRALGEYCKGKVVQVMDAFLGVVERDLGEMILMYNTLNEYPSYHSDRVYGEKSRLDQVHHVAGFLGVYGNSDTAKFLHGAVMRQAVPSQGQLNVAGDDGAISTDDDERTIRQIRTLGEISIDKTFSTKEVHAMHRKRPIVQIGNRLLTDELYTWPTFEYNMVDEMIDARFRYIKRMTRNERRSALGGQVKGFLQSLRASAGELQGHKGFIERYLLYLYETHGLPKEGSVPQCGGRLTLGFVPRVAMLDLRDDPLLNTLRYHYHGMIRIPLRGYLERPQDWMDASSFECNSDSELRYLEMLGYVSSEKLSAVYTGEYGWGKLVQEYANPEPHILTYSVVKAVPQWILV